MSSRLKQAAATVYSSHVYLFRKVWQCHKKTVIYIIIRRSLRAIERVPYPGSLPNEITTCSLFQSMHFGPALNSNRPLFFKYHTVLILLHSTPHNGICLSLETSIVVCGWVYKVSFLGLRLCFDSKFTIAKHHIIRVITVRDVGKVSSLSR